MTSEADPTSEFPSLSGNPQPQYQPPSQAIWQRNTQQTPVQRPQQQQQQQQQSQHLTNAQGSQQQQAIQQRHELTTEDNDDMFTGSTHLQNALNDYRQEDQSSSQVAGSRQPPSTNVEDFPPLGRNGTSESDHDQRSPFAHFSNSSAFSSQHPQSQARQGLAAAADSLANEARSLSAADRHILPAAFTAATNSRSPLENGRPGQLGLQDLGRDVRVTCSW